MIYLYYTLLALGSLPVTLLALVLAPVLPLFATRQSGVIDNGASVGLGMRLPRWLNLFMTPDNSLEGDHGWKTEHMQWRFKYPRFSDYLGYVGWLMRNPAYNYAIRFIDGSLPTQSTGDNTIRDNDNAKAGWLLVKADGLFQFTWIKPIGFSRCIYVNLGWNIRALVDPNCLDQRKQGYRATFTFSPRLSGFR